MNTAAHPDDPKHLAICQVCQANARQEAGELGIDLYRVWSGVAAEVWAPETGIAESWARRILRSPGLARALVTTPSLLWSWLGASIAVLLIGTIASNSTDTPWVQLIAPLLAAAGIAYAYGPGVDPSFELSRSMAISDRMILIARALAVFGFNAAIGIAASLLAGSHSTLVWSWLAPMTAVSALALAVASLTNSPAIGATIAFAAWSVVVLASQASTGDAANAVALALIPIYVVTAAVCTTIAIYLTSGKHERTTGWV